jgi:NAD(P)H-hydrate epimerase
MNLPTRSFNPTQLTSDKPALLIDAIFGTGLERPPRDPFPALALAINTASIPILAVDLPSGMDADTGVPLGPAAIRATRTVTFVAPKAGFSATTAREFTGDVVVADIGCPREILDLIEPNS